MSAIAGIVTAEAGAAEAEPAERMAASLAFRGPDDEGSFRSPEGRAALAVRRLASVDSSDAASQPAANATLDAWLALDGEIVNHRLLRHSLELAGHRFQSGSDAEVAVHAYEQWGLDFLGHLAGAFALALWDDRRDRLVLARDRLGRKPLFFAEHRGRLGFASAVGPLLDEMGLPRLIDPAALLEFLARGWVAPPRTLAAGISALAPGEMLVFERGGGPARSVWGRPAQEERRAVSVRGLSAERHAHNLRTLFECAVADRMAASARVGAVIGSGREGGAVAAAMTRLGGTPADAVAVTADPDGPGAAALRSVAASARCRLAEVAVTEEEAVAAIGPIAAALPVPVAGTSILNGWFAGRAASEAGWVAALGGDGLDEVMLRHPAYLEARRAMAPRWLPAGPAEILGRLRRPRSAETAPAGLMPLPGWRRLPGPALEGTPSPRRVAVPAWMAGDCAASMGYRDLAGRVAGTLCLATDCAFVSHGLEVRLPFLDEQFVGYAQSVPGRVRAPMGAPDALVGRMLDGQPHGAGAPAPLPVGAWLRRGLGAALDAAIRRSPLFAGGLLAEDGATALLALHRAGDADHAEGLWALLVLCGWCDRLGLERVAPAGRDPAALVQSQL